MPKMVVTVPSHLRSAHANSIGTLTLVYTYQESWYNDETQFDYGKLALYEGTIMLEVEDGLYEDIGATEQSIIDYAVESGWFGTAPQTAMKHAELIKVEERVMHLSDALQARRLTLRAVLAAMPATLKMMASNGNSDAFTPDEVQFLGQIQQEILYHGNAERDLRYWTKQRDALQQTVAQLSVPVTLDQDVRTILGA
jgi:hypothetical protein